MSAVAVAEFRELPRTPEVDQEMGLGWDKGKGLELAPESMLGQESWKCDSCDRRGVECVRAEGKSLTVLPELS